jgi:hypothetical protein
MLAIGLDTLLFLFLLGMAGLLRFLANKAGNTENEPHGTTPPPSTTPVRQRSAETEADRMRKFLEALGQPATSTPPPPVKPRETPPSLSEVLREATKQVPADWKRGLLNPLPPVTTVPPPVERPPRVTLPRTVAPAAAPPELPATPPIRAETPGFEVGDETGTVLPVSILRPMEAFVTESSLLSMDKSRNDLAALLRSRSGLRQAMVLREVFGPPRSMQSLDPIGSP